MKNSYTQKEQYYGDYLGLNKILDAQFPESVARGKEAHDEMLFIITHQAYELWFKQIMHELESILDIFGENKINDNTASLQTATHRLNRMVMIWRLLVDQVRVLETMTPMDFLDFRDLLNPASGFQSIQFRVLETRLGLKMAERHQAKYYQHQLRPEDIQLIEKSEQEDSLLVLLDRWLSRMPFWDTEKYWGGFESTKTDKPFHPFWDTYQEIYKSGLRGPEIKNISMQKFHLLFFEEENKEREEFISFSAASCRAILFIYLYREYPLLQLPFQLLNQLLEIDDLMATWRYRHLIMVRKMIGQRIGTGGSSGAGYLRGAMESHHIFGDLSKLVTYLIPRNQLPELPEDLRKRLQFKK